MIPYASRTGTRRNLDALSRHGWRLLVSARGPLRSEGFPYALDNGAWTSYQKGEPFDVPAFEKALAKLGADADWVVAPDIVAGGKRSLELTLSWLERVRGSTKLPMIAVQDGIEPHDVADLIGPNCGLFIGGTTGWKLSTMGIWSELATVRGGAWCHVARVNTARRIRLCQQHSVTSFDGTSASRYAKTLPLLDNARRQTCLEL